jgi:hypothetical protein
LLLVLRRASAAATAGVTIVVVAIGVLGPHVVL